MRGKKNPFAMTRQTFTVEEKEIATKNAWVKKLKRLKKEIEIITEKELERLKQNPLSQADIEKLQIETIQKKPRLAKQNPALLKLSYDQLVLVVRDNKTPAALLDLIAQTPHEKNISQSILTHENVKEKTILTILAKANNPRHYADKELWNSVLYSKNVTDKILVKAIDYILGQQANPVQDRTNVIGHESIELDAFLYSILRAGKNPDVIAKKLLARSSKMPRSTWSSLADRLTRDFYLNLELQEKIKNRYKPKARRYTARSRYQRAPRW